MHDVKNDIGYDINLVESNDIAYFAQFLENQAPTLNIPTDANTAAIQGTKKIKKVLGRKNMNDFTCVNECLYYKDFDLHTCESNALCLSYLNTQRSLGRISLSIKPVIDTFVLFDKVMLDIAKLGYKCHAYVTNATIAPLSSIFSNMKVRRRIVDGCTYLLYMFLIYLVVIAIIALEIFNTFIYNIYAFFLLLTLFVI